MTLVVGIDPSAKHVAAVAYETMTRRFKVGKGTLYPKGETRQTVFAVHAALLFMRHFAEEVERMAPAGDRIAYVETPLVGRGGVAPTIKQAYVGGVIRAWLVESGFMVYDVHPSTWRRELGITAKGTKAIKAATKRYVEVMHPALHTSVRHDGDLVDAAAIALYGASQVRKAAVLSAPRTPPRPVSRG